MNSNLNNKIEDALNSLDGAKSAEPNPFLFTRVMARVQATENVWEKTGRYITRPSFAVAGLAILMLINVIAIMANRAATTNSMADQFTLGTPSDFSTTIASIYDIDNNN